MKQTTRVFFLVLLAAALAMPACSSGDDDDDDNDVSAVDAAAATIDAVPPTPDAVAVNSAVCFPEGIYGVCADVGCPMCLDGAGFYQSCASSCTETPECGDAADFNGATPFCAPLNPGAEQKICVLTCTAEEQCPCGLSCIPSGAGVNICAKSTS